jgi:hypothetical protein
MRRLKVQGYESLVRDTKSNGIINTNTTEYQMCMAEWERERNKVMR